MRPRALERDSIFGCKVSHELYQQQQKPEALVVLFPGRGYTVQLPLLYYAGMAARDKGFDVLALEYGFFKAGKPFTDEDTAPFCEELLETLQAAGAQGYKRLYLISKSLGTVLAGMVGTLLEHPDIRHLFLTPVERALPFMLQTKSVAVMGTADDTFPEACIGAVRADAACELVFIEDADHSLETGQGTLHNLSILQRMANIYDSFLK